MAKRVWRRLGRELRREIVRLSGEGLSSREIAAKVFRSASAVQIVLRAAGGVRRSDEHWEPSEQRLSLLERIEIQVGLMARKSCSAIARELGRAVSTVCREVNANGGKERYQSLRAHQRAWEQARRPKATKLASNRVLLERVIADLEAWWSPEQIMLRLRDEFPGDTTMQVSHETIYKSLYVQGRGELRRELAACLRTGRAQRRPRARIEKRGRIPNMVMISDRPAEAEDRAVPGHWEGDLIIGKNGKSAIGTLVERTTRFVILLHLPEGRTAEKVNAAMSAAIKTLPASLCRSVTWDQGAEMSDHAQFTIDTGIQIFFCEPHSPWQRGSNENTNGLLRQYFPKGTDLSVHDAATLQAAADSLNGRPRKTLNAKTPSERLTELLALTG